MSECIFDLDYALAEIKALNLPAEEIAVGNAKFFQRPFQFGRLDDYLTVNMRAESFDIPTYSLKSAGTYMSMTPMEVQSAYVAIQRGLENYDIGIGGLGLGYVPIAIAKAAHDCRQAVRIDVYEQDPDCIALFHKLYSNHPGYEDIRIIQGDVREMMIGQTYDYVYMDIYLTLASDEVKSDIDLFTSSNEIGEYRFWGQEMSVFMTLQNLEYPDEQREKLRELKHSGIVSHDDMFFFNEFQKHESSRMRLVCEDYDYHMEVIEALQRAYPGA